MLEGIAKRLIPRAVKAGATQAGEQLSRKVERKAAAVASRRGSAGRAREAVAELAHSHAAIRVRFPDQLREKFQRMAASPFAFFRGSAGLFYRDLAATEPAVFQRGPRALLQGDLHLNNLGTVLDGAGKLRYGLVDFDDAAAGSVHLDLRRFATSINLAANESKLSQKEADQLVHRFARTYHETMGELANHPHRVLTPPPKPPAAIAKLLDDAAGVTESAWLDKVAPREADLRRFSRSEATRELTAATRADVTAAFKRYQAGLEGEAAQQLAGHEVVDVVGYVSGVGSIGRARYRVLTAPASKGPGAEAMAFEFKEELAASLAPYVAPSAAVAPATRVLTANRLVNQPANPFLSQGTLPLRSALASDSFLVRRLSPSQAAIDLKEVTRFEDFSDLVRYSAQVIARGHAAGQAVPGAAMLAVGLAGAPALAAELGSHRDLARDLVGFARTYGKQVRIDHAAFQKALAKDPLLATRTITAASH